MLTRLVASVIFILSLFFASTGLTNPLYVELLRGRAKASLDGRTLRIDYELFVKDVPCDSVKMRLDFTSPGETFSTDSKSLAVLLSPIISKSTGQPTQSGWRGQLLWPEPVFQYPESYSLCFYQSQDKNEPTDSVGTTIGGLSFEPNKVVGRQGTIGSGWFTKSGFPSPVHSEAHGIVFHLEDQFDYRQKRLGLFLGYAINHSPRYVLNSVRFGGELALWGRDRWLPVVSSALIYSHIKGYEDPVKLFKKGTGVELGIRLDGPFEGFRYTYNNAAGISRRADATFLIMSGASMKVGTMYSVYSGDYTRGFGIYVYMGGWGNSNTIERRNNRPFWHKGLALVGFATFLPIIIPLYLAGGGS